MEYQLIAGERRWRAARLLNLPHVPVIIKDSVVEDKMKLELALVENLQREDLNPMEEAEAFARLQADFSLTHQAIAERVGKSREVVSNSIRLLGLPGEIQESLRAGKIGRTHARALLAFKEINQQREMFRRLLAGGLGAKDLEEAASSTGNNRSGVKKESRFIELEKNLAKSLGTLVFIKNGEKGGRIVIKYTDLGELNKIVKTILD